MIKSLKIKNVALIPQLEIEFEKGLNILSGETGAGKSVIADSLSFVLGEKTDATLIRQGEEVMTVEAVFEGNAADGLLADMGIETGQELILKRVLTRQGKSDIFINGERATLAMLKKVTIVLIDIYGQSGHSELLRPQTHLQIIDTFDSGIEGAKGVIADLFAEYKKTEKEWKSFGEDEGARERKIDLLDFQIKEIENANLQEGEEEELLQKRTRIVNTEKILTALQNSRTYLENERGAIEQMRLALSALVPAASVDGEIEALRQRLTSVRCEADDINECLRDIAEGFDYDERTADKIQNRIAEIRGIYKKYGADIAAVQAFLSKAKAEYERLTQAEDIIAALQKKMDAQKSRLHLLCQDLGQKRRAAAQKLEEEIKQELVDLGLLGAGISTRFEEGTLSANGTDRAEFFFSANKGEDMRPLAKIISGGEMSRFMLAVKNVTARIFSLPTMVFDEIDTGISGRIAQKVSVKLASISRKYQVISITHLPQIAAMGDVNFLIEKSEVGEKTITSVKKLSDTEKIGEVARLSGGADIATTAEQHAKEMIDWCKKIKKGQ